MILFRWLPTLVLFAWGWRFLYGLIVAIGQLHRTWPKRPM